jgi:hypothetical protein
MIGLLVIVIVVGVILWFVNQYVPMSPPFKTAVNVIAVLLLLLYVLHAFGLVGSMPALRN